MPRRTTTSYAILGLLALKPWTTYELAKQVQRSLNWFWPREELKLYDEPKGLVADGFATARAEKTGKRPRTVYDITPEGRDELARWLGEPPAPRTTEFEGMVKVFFADGGSRQQLLDTLDRMEADAQARLAELATYAAGPKPFPERRHISALCLELHFEQEAAVVRRSRWAREQVHHWSAAADPGDWDADAVLASLAQRAALSPG